MGSKSRELRSGFTTTLQQGHSTYERCNDAAIQEMRDDLFSKSKSSGGRFKELLDELDSIVYRLFKVRHSN